MSTGSDDEEEARGRYVMCTTSTGTHAFVPYHSRREYERAYEAVAEHYRNWRRQRLSAGEPQPPPAPKPPEFPPDPSKHRSPEIAAKCPYCNPKTA